MKKPHAMAALLLAVALSFSCMSIAFADEAAAPADAAATAEAAAPAKTYADLDVSAKSFYNLRYADLGSYPVINGGYDDLNAQIEQDVEDAFSLATDKSFTDSDNVFSVAYTVTDKGQYAQVDVTYNYALTAGSMEPYSVTNSYYVDKEAVKAITADEFKAATAKKPAAAAPAKEEAAAPAATDETADNTNEITMVPIRQYAEGLGYALSWDGETGSVILTKDEARFTVTVGKNEYLVDNEIAPLESAPTNQNGTVYVPVSFFTKVLGATYSIDTDGNIVIE